MIDLTQVLLNKYSHKKHEIGRYYVSDLWAIENRYLTPKVFLGEQIESFDSVLRMWQGEWKHKQIQELLIDEPWMIEIKRELPIDDFVLVGKVDAINEECILEIKTSENLLTTAKSWHLYQLKIYLSLFEKPFGYIVQPIIKNQKLILKKIGEEKRDDKWFEDRLSILRNFHEELKNYENRT